MTLVARLEAAFHGAATFPRQALASNGSCLSFLAAIASWLLLFMVEFAASISEGEELLHPDRRDSETRSAKLFKGRHPPTRQAGRLLGKCWLRSGRGLIVGCILPIFSSLLLGLQTQMQSLSPRYERTSLVSWMA